MLKIQKHSHAISSESHEVAGNIPEVSLTCDRRALHRLDCSSWLCQIDGLDKVDLSCGSIDDQL
uniref:Uncharacterized protein n=1 Tax=Romanomermis culicivorax TaxID=13658 RepID=A0A915KKV4_ROMCU